MTVTWLFAFVGALVEENRRGARTTGFPPRWIGRFPGEFYFTRECFAITVAALRTAHIKKLTKSLMMAVKAETVAQVPSRVAVGQIAAFMEVLGA